MSLYLTEEDVPTQNSSGLIVCLTEEVPAQKSEGLITSQKETTGQTVAYLMHVTVCQCI